MSGVVDKSEYFFYLAEGIYYWGKIIFFFKTTIINLNRRFHIAGKKAFQCVLENVIALSENAIQNSKIMQKSICKRLIY